MEFRLGRNGDCWLRKDSFPSLFIAGSINGLVLALTTIPMLSTLVRTRDETGAEPFDEEDKSQVHHG
jgi:hypothetical protein